MVSEDLAVLTSRSGVPNVKLGETFYHSPYDPVREAEGICASMRPEAADVIFLFGWGLGYCGKVLQSRIKSGARVIVLEPNRALFELSQQVEQGKTFRDSRFQFVVGDKVSRFFDDWALEGCQDTDQFLWIEWPAAVALDGGILESAKRKFKASLRDKAANLLTHFQKGSLYFENALNNFRFHDAADAGRLFGRFADVPLVIVSAGPSLDLNVHHLRGVADRCFILAVDTSLRPLEAAGVTPHAVIAADPSELNARHLVGAIPESTYLIAEQGVQPVALEAGRKRFLFGLGLFPDPLFAKFGFGKSSLAVWGSVATAALDLACRMRANPVIFVGQDFGFSWGREYASHTIFHANTFCPELGGPIREPDLHGNLIHTTENLVAYRDHFVRTIRRNAGPRFINATEGGILHGGPLEILPLREALDQYCGKPVDVTARLSRCHKAQKPSRAALKHLLEILSSRRRDCGCLTGFLDLTARKAVIEHDEKTINAQILWGIERTRQVLNKG